MVTCQRKHWPLTNDRIGWLDYREADEYGLPDYWVLTVGDVVEPHWGRPYHAEGRCPRCEGHTVISEMKFPNGTHEFMHNCRVCGVGPLDDGV